MQTLSKRLKNHDFLKNWKTQILLFVKMTIKLNKKIETVFLMSDPDNQVISSKFVKEIAKLNGKIDKFVTKSTKKALKDKYD